MSCGVAPYCSFFLQNMRIFLLKLFILSINCNCGSNVVRLKYVKYLKYNNNKIV